MTEARFDSAALAEPPEARLAVERHAVRPPPRALRVDEEARLVRDELQLLLVVGRVDGRVLLVAGAAPAPDEEGERLHQSSGVV